MHRNPATGAETRQTGSPDPACGADGGSQPELIRKGITGAVSSKWAKGTGGPAGDECYNLVPVAFSCKDSGNDAGEISPTLRAMPHHHSHMNGGGQVAVATVRVSPTLRADGGALRPEKGTDAVVVSYCPDVAHTLKAKGNDPHRADMATYVVTGWAVRRLTPRECERLQGLPDDYTRIVFGSRNHGKALADMAAYWGVSEEEALRLASDAPRYKAIGNGMAAEVVRWIGQRIEKVEKIARRKRRGRA